MLDVHFVAKKKKKHSRTTLLLLNILLVTSTNSNREDYVGMAGSKVKQASDNTHVQTSINSNSLLILRELEMSSNRITLMRCTFKAKLLYDVFSVFALRDKDPILRLLDLETRK